MIWRLFSQRSCCGSRDFLGKSIKDQSLTHQRSIPIKHKQQESILVYPRILDFQKLKIIGYPHQNVICTTKDRYNYFFLLCTIIHADFYMYEFVLISWITLKTLIIGRRYHKKFDPILDFYDFQMILMS